MKAQKEGSPLQFVTALCLSDHSDPVVFPQHTNMVLSKLPGKGAVPVPAQSGS